MIATAEAPATVDRERGYRLVRAGLVIDRPLTRAEWIACGEQIGALVIASAWALGDWLVYGNGLGGWGDTYGEAHRITGRSFESLSQHARVSREFPFPTRTVAVCWSVYRAAVVLAPDDRERAITVAAANRWTRDDMDHCVATRDTVPIDQFEATRAALAHVNRRRVSKWRPAHEQAKKTRVACPSCGHQFDVRRKA